MSNLIGYPIPTDQSSAHINMSYAKWTQQVALLYYTFEVSKDSALPVIPVLPHKIIRQRKWFISLIVLLISSYHSNRNGVKALGQDRTPFSTFLVLSILVSKISGAIGQTWINIIHQMTESQIV